MLATSHQLLVKYVYNGQRSTCFQCRYHRGVHKFGILAHAEEFCWAERSCTPNRFGVMLQSPTFTDTFLEQYLERFPRADTSPQSKVLNVGVVAEMLILEASAFPADAERFQYARRGVVHQVESGSRYSRQHNLRLSRKSNLNFKVV